MSYFNQTICADEPLSPETLKVVSSLYTYTEACLNWIRQLRFAFTPTQRLKFLKDFSVNAEITFLLFLLPTSL
jgi:hypothetical protein